MKIVGACAIALLGLGGCESIMPPRLSQTASAAPCRDYGAKDPTQETETFGECLSLADRLAATRKPTATVPEATHWDTPVMQGFIAGTTHGATGG